MSGSSLEGKAFLRSNKTLTFSAMEQYVGYQGNFMHVQTMDTKPLFPTQVARYAKFPGQNPAISTTHVAQYFADELHSDF